jgi:cytochrome P450
MFTKKPPYHRLSLAEMRLLNTNQPELNLQMMHVYGDFVHYQALWFNFYLINDPDYVRELLVEKPKEIRKDPITTGVFKRFMGAENILLSEGNNWMQRRKVIQPAFHATRIGNYADYMVQYTQDMLQTWKNQDKVLLDREMTQLTLRIIAKTLFNVDLYSQVEMIGDMMAEILRVGESHMRSPIPPPAWLPTRGNLRQSRALTQLRRILQDLIQQHRRENADKGDILSMLLTTEFEDGKPMSDEDIINECVTLFVAGHETTAMTLTWTWYLLSQHADIRKTLDQELDHRLGDRLPTLNDLDELPWVDMVIKESLRLYPPASSILRTPIQPLVLGPYTVPENALIVVSPYTLHRHPRFFPQPDQFRPERFSSEEGKEIPRYAYIPFGAGPRICIGNMFALMEARLILATMAQSLNLELLNHQPVTSETMITLHPNSPLWVRPHFKRLYQN